MTSSLGHRRRPPRPSGSSRSRYRCRMADDLCFASATWLAGAIRARRVSPLDVVEACLRRIEDVNPRLNAVVRLAADARERARRADAEVSSGTLRGPLHGV